MEREMERPKVEKQAQKSDKQFYEQKATRELVNTKM